MMLASADSNGPILVVRAGCNRPPPSPGRFWEGPPPARYPEMGAIRCPELVWSLRLAVILLPCLEANHLGRLDQPPSLQDAVHRALRDAGRPWNRSVSMPVAAGSPQEVPRPARGPSASLQAGAYARAPVIHLFCPADSLQPVPRANGRMCPVGAGVHAKCRSDYEGNAVPAPVYPVFILPQPMFMGCSQVFV